MMFVNGKKRNNRKVQQPLLESDFIVKKRKKIQRGLKQL